MYEGDAPPPMSPADQEGAALMENNLQQPGSSKPTTPDHGRQAWDAHADSWVSLLKGICWTVVRNEHPA